MSVIHFKFKNSLDYDSITFDGLHLSLKDLKKCIIQKKRLKSEEVDLQVINAQTREEYKDNELLIPRNTSVVIARVPVNTGNTREPAVSRDKVWEAFRMTTQAAIEEHENVSHEKHHELDHGHPISEMDRIKEMMRQSTSDFDPSKYDKKYPTGPVSSTYVCFKCGQIGQHHIYLCPFRGDTTTQDNRMKRSTGIPQSFMIKVDDPNMPGAYKTNTGYAVPAIDAVAYAQGKKERPPFLPNETREEQEPAMPLPKDYMCLLCSNIMTDAVVIPCCGNNYCDECIRNALLETEEHICPTCGESEISPDRLISNRFLRTAISNFYNETGNIVKTTHVIAPPVIHAQHNGPGPQQPGVAPQAQTGPPVTQIPYMPSSRPTGAPFGANALPRLQMPLPSSQGPPPPQQLTPNTPTQDEVAPLVPQTTVTDEELAKGLTIKTTVGYRRPMRLDPQDLPKPRGPPPHSRSLPPRPMRPPGPPPPRFPPPNMPPPGAMLSMPPRIIPPQVLPGPPPAVMLGPLPPVLLPPPPGPIPVFPPPPGPFPPPGVYAEKPLTREEFYRTKKMLKEAKEKKRDLIDDFAKELLGYKRDQTKRKSLSRSRSRSRSRSWSRSRSRSRPRFRSRSFSRSRSRSRTPLRRSITPRRSRSRTPRSRSQLSRSPLSRSPRARRVSRSSSISHSRSRRSYSRSRTRSRSFSPRRSRSRSRLRSLSRGRTPVRLRSKSLSRRRSLTPTRRRSWSRSLSRSRSRTPLKRSSRSRSFSPRGRSVKRFSRSRSRSPGRRSLKRFSRSLSNSPLQKRFSRSPVGKKFSKSPNRPQSSRSPSLGRPATSSSIKKLSRSPSVTKLSRSPNSKRFSKSPGKKDLPKSPERKKLSRSPDSKRISPSLGKKRISQSPGKKILSQSPSKKRLSRSPSKKILSRSPSKKRLSRSPSPRRYSKSPSRRRSKSPTRKRSPLPPRKRSLSPRPRRRSRSPPYHDNFRNDWPPYRSPRSPPQQGYPPGRYTQAQLSYGYMQPGDPYYRYDQQMENYHQYYQDYYQRYGFPPPPPPGTYNRVSQYHEVSHPGPYRPNSPPRGPRTRSPFRGRAPDNRNQDKPRPERRNTDRSSERPKGDNNKKSTNKPQKAMKPGIRKEAKNETDSNKVKQGTANTKEGARKEGATKVVPKDKKKPIATKSKPGVVKVVKEKKDKTSSGKEESDTLAKVKKAPTKRVAEVKEAAAKSDETEKENDKTTTKPKTEAAPESTSEIGTTETQVRSDPPSASEENAVNKAKKKRRLKPPLPSEVEVSQSDSNSEADKKTKPSLKRPKTELEAAVPSSSKDENENASPTKMQKTEPSPSAENEVGSSTDDKIELELEPLPVPETDQLMLDPPEISKWEKEEERFTDSSPDQKSKAAQKAALEKKVLPRSVIESAEKVLSQKPMRPTLASAVSTTSIKPQPAKTGRRVFLDSEGKPEERRVSKNSIQITVSSSAEKRTVTGEEDLRNKLIRDRKLSRESREQPKGSSERSHTLSSVATPVQREGRKLEKTHRALPRKESVMDESKFEPDYDERTSDSEEGNTDKETASSRGSDVSQSQSLSSDTSPAKKQKLDEESQDKDKKHKHRHSRHKKHKKHKHKHKKKKHKFEKDDKSHEKLKSSVATAR
ncbi:hypothetical protein CHS0354_039402 [Potamilus streckersoni]|uniref:E3 ubiquitin-protein ligase RBBP6 n=1 Tax=Potamilus streckersoni TaxID=2493646 RepID=A0AAE0S1N3_9BIVA|nr:hypothetical protein CHS0354_039402 [Potamilus streckersoni]